MSIFSKPKYSTVTVKKKDIPKDIWTKCPKSGEIIYNKELEENLMVVPGSGYHFPMNAQRRIDLLLDKGSFEEHDSHLRSVDPLKFRGLSSYPEKLEQYQKKTGMPSAFQFVGYSLLWKAL